MVVVLRSMGPFSMTPPIRGKRRYAVLCVRWFRSRVGVSSFIQSVSVSLVFVQITPCKMLSLLLPSCSSRLGPASYDLCTSKYEENIIVDCFGRERLEEYRGKHKLDVW